MPLELCAVNCVDPWDVSAIHPLVRWRYWHIVKAEQLLHMVVHTGSTILCQHPHRPGQGESSRYPEGGVGSIPWKVIRVRKGNHILLKVDILQVHPLTCLHVIIKALVFCKEPGPLVQVGVFRLHIGKAKALGEPQLGDGETIQAQQVLRDVLNPAVTVVKLRLSYVGVYSLMVDLCSGVGISVTVTCHLSRSPDIVIADGLPPDARRSLLHALYALRHAVHINLVLQLIPGVAVPAFDQVDHIKHDQEGQGDVDVAIGAGTVMVHHRVSLVGAIEGEACDLCHLAPGHHPDTAVHQQ